MKQEQTRHIWMEILFSQVNHALNVHVY